MKIKGSPIDYGESLVRSHLVDASKKPYFLARMAVSVYGGNGFSRQAHKALFSAYYANQDGVLQPPLSLPLANEVEAFLEEHPDERKLAEGNYGALVLLNMIITEEGRQSGA